MNDIEENPILLVRIFARYCGEENVDLETFLAMTPKEREKFIAGFEADVAFYKPPRRARDAS